MVVSNGVARQVVGEFVDQAGHAGHHSRRAIQIQIDLRTRCDLFETLDDSVEHEREVDGLPCAEGRRSRVPFGALGLVEVGESEDVVHQRGETPRLTVDAASEVAQIRLVGHETVGDELGISRDRGKRGLEFVRDVGGELATHAVVIGQYAHLALELLTLALDTLQHGLHLGIGVLDIAARMIEIDLEQGLDDAMRFAPRNDDGNNGATNDHEDDGQGQRSQDGQVSRFSLGNAHHTAVGKAHRLVEHDLAQRRARTLGGTVACRDCLLDLGTIGMVLHLARVGIAVEQDIALGIDQGDADVLQMQSTQHGEMAGGAVERSRDHTGLVGELGARRMDEPLLYDQSKGEGEHDDGRERHPQDGHEYAPRQRLMAAHSAESATASSAAARSTRR